MEKVSASVQSWVGQHKLAAAGAAAACATAAACGGRRGRLAAAGAAASLAGAAGARRCYYNSSSRGKQAKAEEVSNLELDFYSQLPPATAEDGQENERWSY